MSDDLERAQERLSRTLARARASEDRELAGRVRDEGSQLVHQLNGLLRMSRLHSLDNRAFDAPLRDSARSLEGLSQLLGTLTLAVVEDQIYLNEIRIRLDEHQGGGRELGSELLRHGLGGLRFHLAATEPELRRFVACCAAKPDAQAPRAALRAALEREDLPGIELLGPFRVRVAGEAGRPDGEGAMGALERGAQAVGDAFDNLARGRLFNPLPARRAVTELLAAGFDRDTLGDAPPGCAAHVAHALRVCRLSLLLGREVGLLPALLQDLGVAALLHDVGYAQSPAPDLARHPSAGARLLLRQRGFHLSKVRRVRAVLGHHAPATARFGRRPALLARLLHIAEDYDTLVSRTGLAPKDALARMAGAAGSLYDPVLVQAFVNWFVGKNAAAPPPLLDLPELTLVDPRAEATATVSSASLEGAVTQGVPIRLIHDAHVEGRRGRLWFESEHERCMLHFVDGELVASSSNRPEHSLEALLMGGDLVAPAKIEWALQEGARTGHPPGYTLVSAGLIDTETLEQALSAQARVLVMALVEWEDGRYRFVPDEGPQAEEDEGHAISTDLLIVGAVRALHDPDVVRFALGDLDRAIVRSPDPARRRAAEILGPAESALLELVDGRTTARLLLKQAGPPAEPAQRALLTLLALGVLD